MATSAIQKRKQRIMLHERARSLDYPQTAVSAAQQLNHRGNTEHFSVNFDNNLGNNGASLADGVLATCESDYNRIQAFFPTLGRSPFLLQNGTPITQTDAANFNLAVDSFNRDGIPDLYCLKRTNTGTGNLEVHILSGASKYQSFLLQTGTPITEIDAANFNLAVDSFNRDGIPDLYCLKRTNTGTGNLEVHILSGASNYQSFLLQTGTPIIQADTANFDFAVGDFNRDGVLDLYCLKRTSTGTNKLEVHILNGGAGY
ncbi:hypothetical protein ASPBRDRAFT_49663 [Aspergillus brasiliensis CBS 101740]|uniref:VCBS repeat-containing protein n=1 Tax=Aspergillus brasiliensis (strain CBS 101740 / IMI 381727 / IBT 21946) TaxID=767769 RepID=A0A1L9U1Q5_ASPBC|nr:hypothetical protein ASPBRDRAFT_49663 [Aspergillus brasiliensis CBS 101740]